VELEQRAQQVSVLAEAIHDRLRLYFDWTPQEKTEITLTENELSPAAFATERPRSRIQLHLNAEYAATQGYGNFARLLAHEYAHVLHLDKVAGAPAGLRKVFGRLNLLFPNTMQPTWSIEGLASYAADYLVDPIAIGESEAFQALMRVEVDHGIKPLALINIPVDQWPFVTTPYLYGEEWLHYLTANYGEDSLRNLIENYSDNLLPFLVNSNSRSVYEKDLTTLYQEFENYTRQKYGQQIATIKADSFAQDSLIDGQSGNCGGLIEINKQQYFICNDWLSSPHLYQRNIDSGSVSPVAELPDAGLLDGLDGKLLVLRADWERNTVNSTDLYLYDLNTHELNRLTQDGFYLFGKWISQGTQLIALRYHHDRYFLDLLDANGNLINHLWQSSGDEKIAVYDVSADGKNVLASVWRRHQYWQLEEFSLQTAQWRRLYSSPVAIYAAKYQDAGANLLVTANFNNVPNIYRLDLSNKRLYQLTNVIGMAGSARRFESGVYYSQIGSDGYKIYKLNDVNGRKIQATESLPAIVNNEFVAPPINDKTFDTREYTPFPGLVPMVIVPRINSSNNLKTLGFKTYANDALKFHRYQYRLDHISTIAKNEYQIDYRYDRLFPTFDYHFLSELSLFHDASGSLTSVERANRHNLDVVFPYLKSNASWALFAGLKKEDFHLYAENRNVNLANPPSENTFGIALLFDSSKSFARSISLSEGRSMRFVAEKSLADSDYQGTRLQYEWREYFNLGHAHVVSTKLLAGRVYDRLHRYYLGGEGEVASMSFAPSAASDVLPPSPFGKRGFPFRGYASGIPALTGDSMALISVDWTFPLARINRSLMSPPIGVRHVAGRVFVERGDAWNDQPYWLSGYGMELRFAMQLFYRQSASWRLGISRGNADFSETRLYHYININFL